MQRIVAAVDGSPPALRAVAFAAKLAGGQGAELILTMVVRDLPPSGSPELEDYARLEHIETPTRTLAFAAADSVLENARQIAEANGAQRLSTAVSIGEPAAEIVALAERSQADLIVVGSRGHGRLAGLILGSVAQEVAVSAPCPVTIVR